MVQHYADLCNFMSCTNSIRRTLYPDARCKSRGKRSGGKQFAIGNRAYGMKYVLVAAISNRVCRFIQASRRSNVRKSPPVNGYKYSTVLERGAPRKAGWIFAKSVLYRLSPMFIATECMTFAHFRLVVAR